MATKDEWTCSIFSPMSPADFCFVPSDAGLLAEYFEKSF